MNLQALLALLSVPGIGPARARKLIDHFGSPEAALKAESGGLSRIEGFSPKIAAELSKADWKWAASQLESAEKMGARTVTLWDDDYPRLLKEIYDPPPLLFTEGDIARAREPALAVVGTRAPTNYGVAQTNSIVGGLAGRGFTIVSGMARGIDTEAHKACLEAGGVTVAVLGCGLDITYPRENEALRKRIADTGAVISEFPFGTEPSGHNFPRRNRIISGMCAGALVIEAGDRSGALITARYAVHQNREAFTLPGNVDRPQSRGCNQLIKNGCAQLILSEADILEAMNIQLSLKMETKEAVKPKIKGDKLKIYNLINTDPVYIDDIAIAAGMNPSETLTILFELEMAGLIKAVAGKRYVR